MVSAWTVCLVTWCAVVPVLVASGPGQTEYYGLVSFIFNDYNKNVRPTTEGEGTVVNLNLILKAIVNLDEKDQILQTYATLDIQWTDDYLQWNASDFGGITRILYPQKEMWLPDIVNENSVESQVQIGYDQLKCAIYSDGRISWRPSEIFKTSCDIDVTYYPFDTQKCMIRFTTMMSTLDEIDIDAFSNNLDINLDDYSPSSIWQLVSTNVEAPIDGNFTQIEFTLTIKRLRLYYVVNIIIPVLLLSTTSSMAFYLPADSGEKVGMGITILLSYTVYLTLIADKMPETSEQISLLGVYITILVLMSSLVVILSVVVLNIHHRDPDLAISPQTVRMVRNWRKVVGLGVKRAPPVRTNKVHPTQKQEPENDFHRRMRRPFTTDSLDDSLAAAEFSHSNNNNTSRDRTKAYQNNDENHHPHEDNDDGEEEITWPKVAQTLDRLFFIGFTFSVIATTVILLSLMLILVEV